MSDRNRHVGRTNRNVLITTAAILLALPLVVFVVQQQQEIRQRAQTAAFSTLPPGSQLPTEAQCASYVRKAAWEPRPENEPANVRNVYEEGYRLYGSNLAQYGSDYETRVTGNFTGTTDEIIQWASCKWGFDENLVRAQIAVESSWHQSLLGNCRGGQVQPDTNSCHSVGLLQVKSANIPPTHPGTWPYARISTAFNLDYTLAYIRACYEGKDTATGGNYQAGDEFGCMAKWNTDGWHTTKAEQYIAKIKQAYAYKTWNTYGAGPAPTVAYGLVEDPYISMIPPTPTTDPYATPTPTPDPYVTLEPTPDAYATPTPTPDPYGTPTPTPDAYATPTPTPNPYGPTVTPTPTTYGYPTATPTPRPYGGYEEPTATPKPNPYATATPTPNPYGPTITPTKNPYPQPTFYCLAAPCPVTPDPENPSPSAPAEQPTSAEVEPTSVISAAPTMDPCDATTSLADHRKKKKSKHKDKDGGISKGIEAFMKFIFELLELLIRLLGNQQAPAPTPTPQPEPTEELPQPTDDPCAPDPVPTDQEPAPLPSQTVSSPSVAVPSISQAPSAAPSTSPSAAPSTALSMTPSSPVVVPSGVVSPSVIIASPTDDPCATTAVAAEPASRLSDHWEPEGLLSQFIQFIMSIFELIFRMLFNMPQPQPGVTPTPPVPTVWPVATPTGELPQPIETGVPSAAPTTGSTLPTNAPTSGTTLPTNVPTNAPSSAPTSGNNLPTGTATGAPTSGTTLPTVSPCPSVAQPSSAASVTPNIQVMTITPSTVTPSTPFSLQRER